ncbi:MAG: zf-HC2 domain-containing protein [Actinomycetota bacterium]
MSPRHPSRQRLQRWLDTGETRRVEAHIDTCEHCQAILEELSELDDSVVADLQTAVAAPDDLTDRTNTGVDERLRDEAATGAFLDLFTIGWEVMRAVIDPTTERETPHPDETDADETDGGLPTGERPNPGGQR